MFRYDAEGNREYISEIGDQSLYDLLVASESVHDALARRCSNLRCPGFRGKNVGAGLVTARALFCRATTVQGRAGTSLPLHSFLGVSDERQLVRRR